MSAAPASAVRTPTLRARWRRARYWLGAGAAIVVIAMISLVLGGTGGTGTALDPTNPAPVGAKAVAEVLGQQGVDVIITESRAEVDEALADPVPTTLLLDDWRGVLTETSLDPLASTAAGGATRVILLDPTQDALDAFLPGVRRAGIDDDPAEAAECAHPATRGLGTITGRSTLFQIGDEAGEATGCYATASGLVRIVSTPTATAFGPTELLRNDRIAEESNAALALRVLGAEPRLIWYRPGLADADVDVPPTIGDLSPGWVVPVMLLGVATFLAAAVWRGRRMGPLVVETLPSIVPADEAVRGRARLYARAGARLRAADALRVGTLGRLARELGLPSRSDVETIVNPAAALTGRAPDDLRRLLRDEHPGDDAALVRIAAELDRLEREIHRRIRPPEAGE